MREQVLERAGEEHSRKGVGSTCQGPEAGGLRIVEEGQCDWSGGNEGDSSGRQSGGTCSNCAGPSRTWWGGGAICSGVLWKNHWNRYSGVKGSH